MVRFKVPVFAQGKLPNLKLSVRTFASKIKVCSALEPLGRCWQLWQQSSKNKVCSSLVLFWSVRWMLWFGTVLWISQTGVSDAEHDHRLHTRQVSSAHCQGLYANVVLFMILVDVHMQTCVGVVDEVAKSVERVETDVAKAPTVTPSVIVSKLPGESPRCQVESTRSCQLSLMASEITDFNFVL